MRRSYFKTSARSFPITHCYKPDKPLLGIIQQSAEWWLAQLTLSSIGAMFRSGSAASLTRSSLRYVSLPISRQTSTLAGVPRLRPLVHRNLPIQKPSGLALVLRQRLSTSLQRYAGPYDHPDYEREKEVGLRKLVPDPQEVSPTSSVHEVFHEKGVEEEEKDEDMLAGVKSDFVSLSSICVGTILMLLAAGDYQGDLCSQGSSQRSALPWPGRCLAVPCNLSQHCLSCFRYQPCQR